MNEGLAELLDDSGTLLGDLYQFVGGLLACGTPTGDEIEAMLDRIHGLLCRYDGVPRQEEQEEG